ncbi:hypothetical protein [Psychromonas sp. KJ10-2]|uniref:hypothetical protein n=1 Tax=Psychromonas sp. KJ10-2 TaxID=3391822 RepID=UPI0039B40F98
MSIVLGFLSYRFIEKIKFKKNIDRLSFLTSKPVHMVLILSVLSSYVFINEGNNGWLIRQNIPTQKTYTMLSNLTTETTNWGMNAKGVQAFSECRFNTAHLTNDIASRLKECVSKYGSGTLIIGDSHAIDLFGMVSSRFNDDFIVGVTSSGCRVWDDKNLCPYDEVKDFISSNKHVFNHVIYEQAGFYLLLDRHGDKGSRYMFDKLATNARVEGIGVDSKHVNFTLDYLTALSELVPVTWFGSRVEPHFNYKQILSNTCAHDFELRDGQKAVFTELDQYIKSKVDAVDTLQFISQNKTLDYNFPDDFMTCESLFWADGDHLSAVGEAYFAERLPADFLINHFLK